MKIWFQIEGQETQTFEGDAGEIARAIIEHLNRSYEGSVLTTYNEALATKLWHLLRSQYNGSEMCGVFGVGADKLFYEIKIAEQHGNLQDLDFLVPWE